MLRLRSSVAHHRADEFGALLRELKGVRRVVQQADEAVGHEAHVFVADVEPSCADRLVEEIHRLGIGVDDYVLTRVDVVAPQHHHEHGEGGVDGFAWVEILGQARANSRPLARYLALINVAAVIAALGVITSSSILIVGAMAVSPDLLPICATSVGLVRGNSDLARRAFVTLTLGLGLVVVTAAVLSGLLNLTGFLPDDFAVEQSSLSTLAKTDYSTVLIALAAGVAGMLSFETRASTAVGVAISVTTIPASAYLGVAIGGGGIEHALGALVVLAINVALLIVGGTLTLLVQRFLPNRSGTPI
ncbi:MAG TPA: DUF389 domain-containing protein [Solirubrobacterales bacterium]|jgi:uncharacterized hydrophobic protein (TIGR00271 family)|nr:DUF389 domain-containing protein [Solirubrobacterales bacterium]